MEDRMPARLLRPDLDEHHRRCKRNHDKETTEGKLRPSHEKARSKTAEDPEAA